jgi:phosphoribosylaminoimidazolecarboxamide formyltransferase/IMP cyclohydrolase
VNLYPFEATAARRGVDRARGDREHRHRRPDDDPRGGQELRFSAVVVNPASYDAVLQELTDAGGKLSLGTRESLAAEAFSYTARYDSAISRWFVEKQDDFPAAALERL